MTKQELEQIDAILEGKPFNVRPALIEWRKTAQVTESKEIATRTEAQNKALHLWFKQLADECQNMGVTFDMVIRHTHQVQVTAEGVKHLWHILQKALFGKASTRDLKKTGQIETMLMHFADLFGKEGIELPPFPRNEFKAWEELGGYKTEAGKTAVGIAYPEHTGGPSF